MTAAGLLYSPRPLLLLVLLCPLLLPSYRFTPWLGASLAGAGKSAWLLRVKRAAAVELG
jgi:hypothetical protein